MRFLSSQPIKQQLKSPPGKITPRPLKRDEVDWDNFNLDHLPEIIEYVNEEHCDNFNETPVK